MSRRHSIVDLTSASRRRSSAVTIVESSPSAHTLRTTDPASPQAMARGTKRRRVDDESPLPRTHNAREGTIESVDLTELDAASDLAKTLAKQREDAIKSQQSADREKFQSALNAYKCPVCMDTPENATSTACGRFTHFIQTSAPVLFICSQ